MANISVLILLVVLALCSICQCLDVSEQCAVHGDLVTPGVPMIITYHETTIDSERNQYPWKGSKGYFQGYQQKQQQSFYPPQQQQQQQQQKPVLPDPTTTTAAPTTTKLDEDADDDPEPKVIKRWFLTIPRSSLAVWGAMMNPNGSLGQESDFFTHSVEDLKNSGAIAYDRRSMVVDLSATNFSWTAFQWYLICVKLDFISNGLRSTCTHCDFIRAAGPKDDIPKLYKGKKTKFPAPPFLNNIKNINIHSNDLNELNLDDPWFGLSGNGDERRTKVIDLTVSKRHITAISATVEIQAFDLPVPSGASVSIRAVPQSLDDRCRATDATERRHTDPIYPHTMTIRKLSELSPTTAYSVEVDLILPLSPTDARLMGMRKESILLRRYAELGPYSIPKCD